MRRLTLGRNNSRARPSLAFSLVRLIALISLGAQAQAQFSNGYSYRGQISVANTAVASADQSNFPVLVSGTYSDLATVAQGGKVINANGYDIVFTSDAAGLNPLHFERESYSSNGQVVFWVQVPTLSHSTGTVFYVFYGNASVATDQSTASQAWDSNYLGVWHLQENPSGAAPQETDSTAHGHALTTVGTWPANSLVGGEIGDAVQSNYTSGFTAASPATLSPATALTLNAWIKTTYTGLPTMMSQFNPSSAHLEVAVATFAVGEQDWPFPVTGLGAGYTLTMDGSSGHLRLTMSAGSNGGSTQATYEATSGTVNDGAWHHVAVTYSSGSAPVLYLDGNPVGVSPAAAFTGSVLNAAASLLVPFQSYYYQGSIDEVRISNIARSAGWIATEYQNESNPSSFYSAVWGQTASGSSSPGVGASPLSLSYSGTPTTNPAAQSIAISNSGGGTLNWTATSNQSWLTLSTASTGTGSATLTGTGNQTVWVQAASTAQTPGGPYTGTITISSPGASPASQTVNVSITVTALPGVGASPLSLSYSGTPSTNPPAQSIAISNSGSGTLNWTATSNQSWLTLSTTSTGTGSATLTGTGNQTVWVQAAGTALTAGGPYTGTITISSPGASPASQTVNVSITVTALPGVGASPLSLSYSGTPTTNPPAQSIAISNSGSGTLNWTATSNQSWLTLSTTSTGTGSATLTGTGNQTVWVQAASTALTAGGPYTGTITISAPGASPASQTVNVSITVTALPGVGASPLSLSYSGTPTTNPPAQSIAISNSGSVTLNWTATSNQSWLTLSTTSTGTGSATLTGTGNQTVWVQAAGTALTAGGPYTGTITISAPGASPATQTVNVSITVTTLPGVGASPLSLSYSGTPTTNPAAQSIAISNSGGGTLNWTATSNQGNNIVDKSRDSA